MARTPYWEDTVINASVVDDADDLRSLVGGLSEDERRGMTIVRTIISLQLTPLTTSGVVGSMVVDLGVGIANEQAFTAGAGSLPDPAINSERPPRGWIWRDRVMVLDDATTLAVPTVVHQDLRSKRKVDAGIPYLTTSPSSRTGTDFTIRISGIVRLLYLMA